MFSAAAPPQTLLGELTALPQAPLLDLGAASRQGGLGWGRGGKEGGEGEGGGSGGEGPQVTVEPAQRLATPLSHFSNIDVARTQ